MMNLHKQYALAGLMLTASVAWSQTPIAPPQWQSVGALQYVCGGVSDEAMNAIKTHRGDASSELLFTSGPEGAYLAEVAVTIQGGSLKEPVAFNSSGPLCLLKLPQGSYTVQANYKGVPLKQTIKVDGGLKQNKFNWTAI
jgi:hypothetical protein